MLCRQKSCRSLGLVGHLAYIISVTVIVVVALVCLVAAGRGHYAATSLANSTPASFRAVLTGLSGDPGASLPGQSADAEGLAAPRGGSKASKGEVRELLAQVGRDLEPWRESGITLQMVEKNYCTEEIDWSARIQILNGSIYLVGPVENFQSRLRHSVSQLLSLSRTYRLPDVDLVWSVSDYCKLHGDSLRNTTTEKCPRRAPLLSQSKLSTDSECVPVPDFTFGGWPEAFLPSWSTSRLWMAAAADKVPWRERRDLVFWRGGFTNEQRRVLAKSEIIQASGKADIQMISWEDDQRGEAFNKKFVSLAQHCQQRYLLHIAGYTYSGRLKYLLACGSPVIYASQEQTHVEFWHHMLRNGTNIVFMDRATERNKGRPLLDTLAVLHANQTRAEAIGEAGRHLAMEVLHPDNVARYWLELLTQYSRLQTFRPSLHQDARPLEDFLMRPERLIKFSERTCKMC